MPVDTHDLSRGILILHHFISGGLAVVGIIAAGVIVRKRLYHSIEMGLCLALLGLYAVWQIAEIFSSLAEHLFGDIFKLAPMLLLIFFEIRQNRVDDSQEDEISELRKRLNRMESRTQLKGGAHLL